MGCLIVATAIENKDYSKFISENEHYGREHCEMLLRHKIQIHGQMKEEGWIIEPST